MHTAQLEAEAIDDVLLFDRRLADEEKPRLRVVLGKLRRLRAQLGGLRLPASFEQPLCEGSEPRRTRLKRTAAAERVRLVVGTAAVDLVLMKAVALVVVDLQRPAR